MKRIFIVLFAISSLLIFAGCSKDSFPRTPEEHFIESYFEGNILTEEILS